jgi:hypothetical protein
MSERPIDHPTTGQFPESQGDLVVGTGADGLLIKLDREVSLLLAPGQ